MFKKMFDLTGRVAIVSGGLGLIGSKFCEGLADFGAKLVIVDINKEKIYSLAEEIRKKYSTEVLPLVVDITDKNSVKEGVKEILDKFGKINILVNAAYPRNKDYGKKFEDLNFETWQENLDMNIMGSFIITQIVAKQMMKQKEGNIVNIGSMYGLVAPDFKIYEGTEWSAPSEYPIIKGGIIQFTRYLAVYLAPYNIRVNCISPGGIYANDSETFLKRYAEKSPMGRKADAQEIVGGLIYLVSDASSYVTGHNLVIDGGWTVAS
jgi:NAD(P)-dependent dehydrogenase (short-subunit alcohol dehydrogenase family)